MSCNRKLMYTLPFEAMTLNIFHESTYLGETIGSRAWNFALCVCFVNTVRFIKHYRNPVYICSRFWFYEMDVIIKTLIDILEYLLKKSHSTTELLKNYFNTMRNQIFQLFRNKYSCFRWSWIDCIVRIAPTTRSVNRYMYFYSIVHSTGEFPKRV